MNQDFTYQIIKDDEKDKLHYFFIGLFIITIIFLFQKYK